MTTGAVPSLEDFVRPVSLGDADVAAGTPLSRLPVGDFVVLAWLDDLELPFAAEASVVSRWDTTSPRDVYLTLHPGTAGPATQTTGAAS